MLQDQLARDSRVLARRDTRVVHPFAGDVESTLEVIVGIALRNQASTLRRCLESVVAQKVGALKVGIVILDDGSEDDWRSGVGDLLNRPDVVALEANCGSAARARNAILDYVDDALPNARWVARLDADDRFATHDSLAAAIALGDQTGARFVLGGNSLCVDGSLLAKANLASRDLMNRDYVLGLLRKMADGTAENELPSCNLVLASHSGWRYPDADSAEDHCLVAELLINHSEDGAILTDPLYCEYSLKGAVSEVNGQTGEYHRARRALHTAAENWVASAALPGTVLGCGREGVVRVFDGMVEKRFHPGKISGAAVAQLETLLRGTHPFIPEPSWSRVGDQWCCQYPYVQTEPVDSCDPDDIRAFLLFCLEKRIVCVNIKRDNLRRRSGGGLMFIDISESILPMNVGFFVDSAARLYAIGMLGWSDRELCRRGRGPRTDQTLQDIPGFAEFYRDLLAEHARRQWQSTASTPATHPHLTAEDVTLMIKACAMDATMLVEQVTSIVGQLQEPRVFHERVLVIDSYRGPFLREHDRGDFTMLLAEAERLRSLGIVDKILVSPESPSEIAEANRRWFGVDCAAPHTVKGIPVAPQLWAFDQVTTRYLLQCDVDVLIGRRDWSHDYLQDMLNAVEANDALGVAFNIPHAPSASARPYDAPPGEYVPEVRCGLLDMDRIGACRPLPNSVANGRLELSWYRSLQRYQLQHGLRTLRGGDPRTFYIHPPNNWKHDPEALARVRDLVGQARIPPFQREHWDLEGTASDWMYPCRAEEIVFLIKGRNIPAHRIERCLGSLVIQNDQRFGVVMIADASEGLDVIRLPELLGPLRARTTLIRRRRPHGRIPNFITAIRDVCTNPESLVVILDLDDALIDRSAVARLCAEYDAGGDVILGAMFRPDKPTKVYHPDFSSPRANRSGGDVWIHLRSFRKKLFDALPDEALQIDGRWIEECTDYATMIPIVELACCPRYVPEYLYFHERTTPRTPERRRAKDAIIDRILMKPKMGADIPSGAEVQAIGGPTA